MNERTDYVAGFWATHDARQQTTVAAARERKRTVGRPVVVSATTMHLGTIHVAVGVAMSVIPDRCLQLAFAC